MTSLRFTPLIFFPLRSTSSCCTSWVPTGMLGKWGKACVHCARSIYLRSAARNEHRLLLARPLVRRRLGRPRAAAAAAATAPADPQAAAAAAAERRVHDIVPYTPAVVVVAMARCVAVAEDARRIS